MSDAGATHTCPTCGATYGPGVLFCPNDRTQLDRSAGALTGQIIAERYRILSKLGEGGMGQVLLAEHVHLRRKCAIKFLHADLAANPAAMKRFYREAENASRIDHPNVVKMYDFGEAGNGSVYLAMEFVEGESLQKRIERQSSMPRDLLASIIRQTALALQAAHALGITHRDLKPDNVMLITTADETRVKVVDFGIARAGGVEQKVTVTGAIVGTPDYMAPEQLMAGDIDGRADQYALALIAVKMLTGKLPFATATSVESITSRLTEDPMPLRALRADVAWPQLLQDVVGRALATEPGDRYPTIVEFSRSFDRAIGTFGAPMSATVVEAPSAAKIIPPARVDSNAPPRRARSRVGLAASITAIVLLGGGAGLWQWTQGRQPSITAPSERLPVVSAADSSIQLQSAPAATASAVPPDETPPPISGELQSRESGSSAPGATSSLPANTRAPAVQPTRLEADRRIGNPEPSDSPASAPQSTAPVTAPIPTPDTARRIDTPHTDTTAMALAPERVQALYGEIRAVVQPDAPEPTLRAAVQRINALLPRSGERLDSVRLLYVRAQGEAYLGQMKNACETLAVAAGLARSSTLENALTSAAERLSCP